jgi:ligand-binding sensor domain-containing protein
MKLHILLLLLILTISTFGHGQNQKPPEPETEQAVTANIGDTVPELSKSILIVFQSTNGDYWYGSDKDGVYRFDGKTVIHFSAKDGLTGNRIRSIQEDKRGNIYFSTLDGISKFDGHAFTTLAAIPSLFPGDHWKLQPDDLWFCMPGKNGERGPYRFDGKNLYQLEFPKHFLADDYYKRFPNNAWSPYEVYYIYRDRKGNMWFGTSNFGVCRYDGESLSWLYEDHLTFVPNGGSFGIRSILEDTKGKFWFCNTQYRFNISPVIRNENGKVLIRYEKEKGIEGIKSADGTNYTYFMSVLEDDRGDLWMATYNQGVWKYDGKKVTHYSIIEDSKDVTLYYIYKDRKGVLWLGTHESGAYKYNGKTFVRFKP